MVRDDDGIILLRLLVNDMRDVVDGSLACAVGPIQKHGRTGTNGGDHGRGDEELGRRQGWVGFSCRHEEGESCLIEVDWA